MKTFLLLFATVFFSGLAYSQNPVNAYAKVTSLSGLTITVTSVDEQFDSFEDGEKIIIMQMQGASITDSSNAATFGSLSNIGSAGLYEICTISSHTENAGVPDTIKVTSALINSYNISGTVQIISFPTLGGGGNFTTVNDITATAFDGQKGGVLCFEVQGNLYLQHNISADGKGFRGGAKTPSGVGGACDEDLYSTIYSNDAAMKGEGIIATTTLTAAGRAPAINGGGGGVQHNGGGAGGGNYTAGGYGGVGYVHLCTTMVAGGLGGYDLQWNISPDRIFFGGGGGGGHDNDTYGTDGAAGGGIIILKCDTLFSSGSCMGVSVSADGDNAANDAQDGKGGGGAGGTIVLDVQHAKSYSSCPFKISANGGNGGNVTVSKQHAGGGGGGQGVIMLLCGGSEQNVVFETKNGKGGKNMTSFSPSYAGDAAGVDNTAIFIGIPSDTVPAIFTSMVAQQDSFKIVVQWTTTFEKNVSNFQLQYSSGGVWQTIATIAGHGPGVFTGTFNYSYNHTSPQEGGNYYRLLINDTLGCSFYSPYWVGNYTEPVYEQEISIFPNPVKDDFIIRSNYAFEDSWFKVYDARGREVNAAFEMITEKKYHVYAPSLAQGVYFVRCLSNKKKRIIKFVVWN